MEGKVKITAVFETLMDTIRNLVSFPYTWEFIFFFVPGAVILEKVNGFGWLYQASACSGWKDPFWL